MILFIWWNDHPPMYSRICILASCFVSALFVQAQRRTDRVDLTWGTPLNIKKDGECKGIIDHGDDAYYLSLKRNEEERIARLGQDLSVSYVKPIGDGLKKSSEKLEGMVPVEDKFIVFLSEYDKKAHSNDLYAQPYSKEAYMPLEGRQRVASIAVKNDKDLGRFHITGHYRGADIICIDMKGPDTEYGRPSLPAVFLDQNLKPVEEKDLPQNPEQFLGSDDDVADKALELKNGTEVFLTRQYPDGQEHKGRGRESDPTFTFVLQVYENEASQPFELPLKVPGKFLQDLKFMEDSNGDVLCIGFYGEEESWDVRGVFFIRINGRTWAVSKQDLKPFTDEFITEGLSSARASRAINKAERNEEELALPFYDLNEMVRRPDGSVIMVAQQFKTWETTAKIEPTPGFSERVPIVHFYHGDILVVSIAIDGTIGWTVKIPHRQKTDMLDDAYSGYLFHLNGDQVQFVFNENMDNLSLPPGESTKSTTLHGAEAITNLVTITSDGIAHRELLYEADRAGTIIRKDLSRSFTDHTILLYTEHGSSYQFCEVKFK